MGRIKVQVPGGNFKSIQTGNTTVTQQIIQSRPTVAAPVPSYYGGGSSGANPTASVGLTAVNGSATTFMRSDGAPKLDVSISPTWTGTHTFSSSSDYPLQITGTAHGSKLFKFTAAGSPTGKSLFGYSDSSGSGISNADPYSGGALVYLNGTEIDFYTAGNLSLEISTASQVSAYEGSFGSSSLKNVATYDSGSFTGSLTGCSGTPTGTIYWRRVGPIVTLFAQNFTGTSNADTLTMTGLPSALQAAYTQELPCIIADDSATVHGMVSIGADGTLTFFVGRTNIVTNEVAYNSNDFTSSGSKGPLYFTITYSLI